jgi:hypothetical protein
LARRSRWRLGEGRDEHIGFTIVLPETFFPILPLAAGG